MAKKIKSWPVTVFKQEHGIRTLNIFQGRKSLYCLDQDGTYMGSVDPESMKVPVEDRIVLLLEDETSSDQWLYFTVRREDEPIDSW